MYSFNRQDVTPEDVERILAEFERVKLLFRWTDPATSKQWGYFVGIEKPGRLPARSRLLKGHEALGPEPPKDLLQSFFCDAIANGQPVASHPVANGSLGFGFCLGSGSGRGNGQPTASQDNPAQERTPEESRPFNSTEVALMLCQKNGWSGKGMIWALQAAIEFQAKRMPEVELAQVGEWLLSAYSKYRSEKGRFAVNPQKFFEQGLYSGSSEHQPWKTNEHDPAAYAQAQMEAD